MHRFMRVWKDETAVPLLEYSVLVGLIIAASIATVLLASQLAGGQWTVFDAILQ